MTDLKQQAQGHVTAGILTGGGSRRFGRDKAFYPWKGRTLVEWTIRGAGHMTDDIYLLVKERQHMDSPLRGIKILEDHFEVPTPLNGIHSIIPHVKEWLLLLACDIPFFDEQILNLLWEYRSMDKATVIRADDRYHPFLGLYPVSVLSCWDEAFAAGEYHLQRIVERMPRVILEEDLLESRGIDRLSFANINSPADLERLPL
ncbi:MULTISPECIES: molybdenum cofactor guanylyltransferase [unclassified Oceanispirochaeta]|uniref:molybdenum cofactor guanylyltransferase n=1 Tax=unclassified Oceanispirochaeta TaxID=2635722 RepID=UPI000E095550|nr:MULTISPECIES: molybdenum cofactor guanylyltransferase [unclassified Oceanispirochaeta]MBF9014508.1 molybdenum cofactor guanylyltransferase [Oceanispirochaeta sp. M2]NPD70764.1 molybdenum cofactor guanylyltransferase [Oceanispirochaeta sp. M1]RDG34045.1 molybdenum cofactor guanylyltransferase [Oceanispirochaeta sp. M1]